MKLIGRGNESGHCGSDGPTDWLFIGAVCVLVIVGGFGIWASVSEAGKLARRQMLEAQPRVVTNTTAVVGITEIKGHLYLIFPNGVVHDEACPCKTK
jgi:hypothetical protein